MTTCMSIHLNMHGIFYIYNSIKVNFISICLDVFLKTSLLIAISVTKVDFHSRKCTLWHKHDESEILLNFGRTIKINKNERNDTTVIST